MWDLRKLAVLSLSFSAAVFAADYWLPLRLLPWMTGAFAFLFLLLALPRRRWLLGFTLAAAGLALGFLSFYLHAQRTLIPAQKLDGQTLSISGEVCSYPQTFDDYSRMEILVSGTELPRGKMLLYADGDALAAFEPGDRILCTAKLKRPDLRFGERYDSYLSRGIYLTGNAQSEPQRIGGGSSLGTMPLRLNRAVSEKIQALFPSDTAPFMKSLMLGDKTDLYEDLQLYLAMSRAGFLHIVAVSGMHIAFLVGLIQLLFGKTWRSSLLALLLIWFFVLLTGSSPSAIRAAVMQSFLLAAPLVRRENDPATSLSAALAMILIGNPYAAGSVSLQLSFSAMAGILCLAEPLHKSFSSLFSERWAHLLRVPLGILASSLAVLAFSLPFMAWHFGSLSLLAPLTNMLGLWAVSFCFCGGYLSCLLGLVFAPLGSAAAWLISWPVRYLILVAELVSSIPFAVLYLKKLPSYLWLVLVYALCLISACSRMKTWAKLLMPLTLSALMLALLLTHTRSEYRSFGVFSVIDVGQGQSIAVMSGDETLVIDCGGINTLDNAGEETGSYLISCGRERIDALFLTHLHADHVNGVPMLLEMLPVERIILPAKVEDEDGMLDGILTSAEKHGTELIFLEEDSRFSLPHIQARLFAPLEKGQINERCMTGVFSLGDYDMLVTGDSSKSTEKELLQRHSLKDLELLIVGHHGSRYASSGELLGSIGAKTAVISVGYNNFGHPTYETLERLDAYGYTIYRTDLNGTVEIRVEN
ncbi:MAG: DNA internalization-related competence protein ComEC/Rec2 [Oscillospiraceae bacterium]|nr:DNA internalization-related competence protein ComEC/Rec2 [Oscillospiraceae bacterium]